MWLCTCEIDVWSDYACPWCALGLARLGVALARLRARRRSLGGAPLIRAAPRGSGPHVTAPWRRRSRRKYGMPPEQVRGRPRPADRPRSARSASSSTSRRCVWAAPSTPTGSPRPPAAPNGRKRWCSASSSPYFSEGRQLSDHRVPCGRARTRSGSPRYSPRRCSAARPIPTEVRADEAAAAELEVTGVPYFLIGRRVGPFRGPRTSRRWHPAATRLVTRLGH